MSKAESLAGKNKIERAPCASKLCQYSLKIVQLPDTKLVQEGTDSETNQTWAEKFPLGCLRDVANWQLACDSAEIQAVSPIQNILVFPTDPFIFLASFQC